MFVFIFEEKKIKQLYKPQLKQMVGILQSCKN